MFGADEDFSQHGILGRDNDVSQHETTLLIQQDDEAPQENNKTVTGLNVHQVSLKGNTSNLQHDIQELQEKNRASKEWGRREGPFFHSIIKRNFYILKM